MSTLFEGAALAVFVVFLFLRDWRATVIAAITLPLSIIPSFWAMDQLGFSLNIVSLLAITLSTGILVDDAIVEIENIVRHIRMGKSPYQAALEAADEIGFAVIAISLTIVAVFIPASFMTSFTGQFFKQFGLTVAIQVIFSLLCARLITPMLAAYFMRPHAHEEKPPGRLMTAYTRLVGLSVRRRVITVAIGLVLFALSILEHAPAVLGLHSSAGHLALAAGDRAAARLAARRNRDRQRGGRQRGCAGGRKSSPSSSMAGAFRPRTLEVRKATLTINYVPTVGTHAVAT